MSQSAEVIKYNRWHPVPKELEEKVIAFYLEGNSTCSASKKFGISAQKVLKRNGIKLRSKAFYQTKLNTENYPEIISDYKSGMSVPKMETKFGLGKTRLYEILDINGIKRRSTKEYKPKSSGKEKEIISIYQSGISAAETGKYLGVCEATVLYVLKNNNIKLRPPGISDGTLARGSKGGLSKDPEYMRLLKKNYRNERRKKDPLYKMVSTLRSRVSTVFRRQKKDWKKDRKTCELLGGSWIEVFHHIESQFQEGMTWQNHGSKGWHVDHIVPLSSARNFEELIELFNFRNLQPLWAIDNHKKGSKICQNI